MFAFNPVKRYTIDQIRNHEWYIKGVGYNDHDNLRQFFQNIMSKIHRRLLREQKETISQFQTNTLMPTVLKSQRSIVSSAQSMQTKFAFSQLGYELYDCEHL